MTILVLLERFLIFLVFPAHGEKVLDIALWLLRNRLSQLQFIHLIEY